MGDPESLAMALIVAGVAAALGTGLQRAGRLVGVSGGRLLRVRLGFVVTLSAWLLCVGLAALEGRFAEWEALPPRIPMAVGLCSLLLVGPALRREAQPWLVALPLSWPIGIQLFRLPVEAVLWRLSETGRIPVQMSFEGQNFDVLVGITAPLVAQGLAMGHLPRRFAQGWNVLGLLLLANVVRIAATSIPGPLRVAWPGEPLELVAWWPFVWLPTFLVPVAFAGHVLSLRQLQLDGRAEG